MAKRFEGKVALVTGAGVGIGYEVCRALAHEGATVALNDVDNALAQRAAQTINNEIGAARVAGYSSDVADVAATRQMVADVAGRYGTVDIAVANAGITQFGSFLEYEPEQFDRLMGVNLRGSFFTAQAAARVMVAKGTAGRIVFMSSVTGVQAVDRLGAYGVSKAGLRMMARVLAAELGPHGITTNAVGPGATITERTLQESKNYEASWASVIPTRRAAQVADIAAAVLFLCSAEARHITGQTLMVDGGWTMISPVPPNDE